MSGEVCNDDRFELIDKAKAKLFECTNIEDRQEEVAVLDNILFRCWQMGWLDQLRENHYAELFGTPERAARTLLKSTPTCRDCVIRDHCTLGADVCMIGDYDALLEWLKGEGQ